MAKAWNANDPKRGMTVAELRQFIEGLPDYAHLKAVASIKGRLQKIEAVEDK